MIVGENAKPEDLDVNAVKEKHLTNIRSVHRRRAGAAGARPPALARPGAGVPARGRVRGGHARERAAAQGRAGQGPAREAGAAREGRGGRERHGHQRASRSSSRSCSSASTRERFHSTSRRARASGWRWTGEGDWDAVVDGRRRHARGAVRRARRAADRRRRHLAADRPRRARGHGRLPQGRLRVRRNLHLGVGLLAATSAGDEPGRLRFASVKTRIGEITYVRGRGRAAAARAARPGRHQGLASCPRSPRWPSPTG